MDRDPLKRPVTRAWSHLAPAERGLLIICLSELTFVQSSEAALDEKGRNSLAITTA